MPQNPFENNRNSEGTLIRGAQHSGIVQDESKAISRDDVRDGFLAPTPKDQDARARRVLAASTLKGDRVRTGAGQHPGSIEEIMLDPESGRIVYAVISFGGFLGIGDKLFAVPWGALRIDRGEHEFVLDVDPEMLEKAPGFDKNHWPDMGDPVFERGLHEYYGRGPVHG